MQLLREQIDLPFAKYGDQHVATKRRKSPAGISTSDVVVTAHVGTNAQVFPQILALHVPPGATVADVTYGKGVFWQSVPVDRYKLLPTDLQTGVDCRALPYEDSSIDCVVLDPPTWKVFTVSFSLSWREGARGRGLTRRFGGNKIGANADKESKWEIPVGSG